MVRSVGHKLLSQAAARLPDGLSLTAVRDARCLLLACLFCFVVMPANGESASWFISARPDNDVVRVLRETALIQRNGDPNTDLFYTMNFAVVGLHEAAAATGEKIYRDAADKLGEFFCRVQVKSETHPEFDGGWFRGFDYGPWEYWGSDADIGWSPYSRETGWIQGEVLAVLVLRQLKTSLWDYTAGSGVTLPFQTWRERLLPDEVLRKATN